MDAISTLRRPESSGEEVIRPLRTALVLPSLAVAGAERQTVSLARNLDRDRFDPTLIPLRVNWPNVTPIDQIGMPAWSPELAGGFDLTGVRRLAAYFRKARFEVLICANQYATLASLLARRIAGLEIPVWSVFHSPPGLMGNSLRSKANFSLYWHALRYCSGIVFVSELQRMAWMKCGRVPRCPAVVINNGIDLSPFAWADGRAIREQLGWSNDDYVVGVCAHLRPEKRIPDLVEAVRLLLDRGLPMRLLIAGDGPCRAEIEAACRAHLGDARWAMVGMQKEVAPFIHACSAMALVSEVEAFSIGILEAMASSKPLVVTDVGGAREQIVHGVHGYIVPVAEPQQIADHLERLWYKSTLHAFGVAARARVASEFSIDAMVRRYSDLLVGHALPTQTKVSELA